MKLYLAALAVLVLGQLADVSDAACSRIAIRREIRSISQQERNRYFRAIKTLNSGPRPNGYDYFTRMHLDWASRSHGDARFLPWHRVFIREFEKALQRIDPGVILPYWDWARDANDPAGSPVLSASLYGSNGGAGGCVNDGAFSGWRVFYPDARIRCLTRKYDGGNRIQPWWGTGAMNNLKNTSPNYDNFRRRIEGPHGNVHIGIGGDFSPMWSPNDPLFWLHHAFVDKLWSEWQARSVNNLRSYGGAHSDGSQSVASEPLGPFGRTVGSSLSTMADDLCYRYDSNSFAEEMGVSEAAVNGTVVDENIPPPLPEWWILHNKLNVTEIRVFEKQLADGVLTDRIKEAASQSNPQ
ncbi:hypothetical protein H4R33_005231 [Dimargaris cristalligena]|uniref:Tyrosinase copper-binding domain-containing protein n=1 Tax=Dimargaris cristalligena TaxID=215637 RepID=A0A4V1J5M0_9FUNG|nr:hypothetical protein H4R33_005231 [Dimargaris cristalligena]RKP39529.1 hypothetical protein BJ085DRAFT_38261 [Dimargaris cristalligena]|eukprot:RKP39529.1 hypothetical protein BJ085DRAFT_38261 [Dimargaris cristalligena]